MTQEKIIRGKECVNMNRGCKATAEPRHGKKNQKMGKKNQIDFIQNHSLKTFTDG